MSSSGQTLQRGSGVLMPGAHSNPKRGAQQQQPDDMPLPMKNNLILERQKAAIHAFQQRVIEESLRQYGPEHACQMHKVATLFDGLAPPSGHDEDDAPLPSTRYAHMSDTLQPERSEEHFDQWCKDMQQESDALMERVQKERKLRQQEEARLWEERKQQRIAEEQAQKRQQQQQQNQKSKK